MAQRNFLIALVVVFVLGGHSFSFADADHPNTPSPSAPVPAPTVTPPADPTSSLPPSQNNVTKTNPDGTPKIADLAQKADDKTQIIKIGCAAAAAFMGYQCVAGWPGAVAQCVMSALLLKQALDINNYQQSATPTTNEIKTSTTTGDAEAQPPAVVQDTAFQKTAENTKSLLASKGIKLGSGTVSFPNGKQYSSGVMSSKAAFQAAGLDGGAYDQGMGKLASAQAEASRNAESSMASQKSGGSSGGEGGSGRMGMGKPLEFTELESQRSWSGQDPQMAKQRGLASLAGASKKMGQDNIGISADNIFQMVQRRYDKKRQQKSFIEK